MRGSNPSARPHLRTALLVPHAHRNCGPLLARQLVDAKLHLLGLHVVGAAVGFLVVFQLARRRHVPPASTVLRSVKMRQQDRVRLTDLPTVPNPEHRFYLRAFVLVHLGLTPVHGHGNTQNGIPQYNSQLISVSRMPAFRGKGICTVSSDNTPPIGQPGNEIKTSPWISPGRRTAKSDTFSASESWKWRCALILPPSRRPESALRATRSAGTAPGSSDWGRSARS
ncbi:hypothetical protein BCC1697_001720 [Burkholderia gladioli]